MLPFILSLLFIALAAADDNCPVSGNDASILVNTNSGPVQGFLQENGRVKAFLGIPYAAPPVGDLRFRAPVDHEAWTSPRDAKLFGSICTQWSFPAGAMIGSEDCLYLNVWAPVGAKDLPVIFYIHGGGQAIGNGGENGATYFLQKHHHGNRVADQTNVVFVSINYRLGGLGFLALPELAAEGTTGSYGNLDQIKALKWVKANIAKFGGDPKSVLLMGLSGGAQAVHTLYASPLTEGLFKAAWTGAGYPSFFETLADKYPRYQEAIANLNCTGFNSVTSCLRGVPAQSIFNALSAPYWFNNLNIDFVFSLEIPDAPVGGGVVNDFPLKVYSAGRVNKNVPLIVGNSENEHLFNTFLGTSYSRAIMTPVAQRILKYRNPTKTDAQIASAVETGLDMYESSQDWFSAGSDLTYLCSQYEGALKAAAGGRKVYRYINTFVFYDSIFTQTEHVAESPFESRFLELSTFGAPRSPANNEYQVMEGVQSLMRSFAASGKPGNCVNWPLFKSGDLKHLEIDTGFPSSSAYRRSFCDYWLNPFN